MLSLTMKDLSWTACVTGGRLASQRKTVLPDCSAGSTASNTSTPAQKTIHIQGGTLRMAESTLACLTPRGREHPGCAPRCSCRRFSHAQWIAPAKGRRVWPSVRPASLFAASPP
ncbi:hypothetical protein MXAN_0574 [Myxococcus xanthus DK 1622]|uniref:Uncharacterized protein n=1 Tax=Myxococcus xanthus (strain DK1622) TaxID=246197 RepID=Q1DET1_MYXXD|nr:hypothetical protein MXAN_0574 [Myxococcus xanthus DK 1622]